MWVLKPTELCESCDHPSPHSPGGYLYSGRKSDTILIVHGHRPDHSFPLNIGKSRLGALWPVYWFVVIGAKVHQVWDSPEHRGKGPSIFSILHQSHSGPLACPVQYSFVVSSQKRLCSLLWLQGQSLHVLSSLSLCLLKVLAGMGVTVTTPLRSQNTFSFSPILGKPISRSPSVGYLGKIRGNRVVFKESRSSLHLPLSVVPCGVWHVPFNVFKIWGGGDPYWWQDLRVGIACDNFPFMHSLKAKYVKALETRKGDYSQKGWSTTQIGISKWRCLVACWERQDISRWVIYGSQMRVRWLHNSPFFIFWLFTCLSFFFFGKESFRIYHLRIWENVGRIMDLSTFSLESSLKGGYINFRLIMCR